MPFLTKSEDNSFGALVWNILYQMRFNSKWNYFNNGFACSDEPKELYGNRLIHIAAQLNAATKAHNPGFICLQECPEDLHEHFVKALKIGELKDYAVSFYHNPTEVCYLITLHDTRRYKIVNELSEEMKKLVLSEGLKSKIAPLVYSEHKTGEIFLVVNVHATFSKEVKNDVLSLYKYARQLGIKNIILLGDFNRDLLLKSDSYSKHDISEALDAEQKLDGVFYAEAVHGASFMAKYDSTDTKEKKQVIETRDGTLSTFKAEAKCLTHINKQVASLSLSKEIATDLCDAPKDLFEMLSKTELDRRTKTLSL